MKELTAVFNKVCDLYYRKNILTQQVAGKEKYLRRISKEAGSVQFDSSSQKAQDSSFIRSAIGGPVR